jgi:acetoin utilization deacetylase AcuC-like enzyme
VRSTSASRGSRDDETVLSPGSYRAALHAAGGACAMVDALLAGEAPAAFCGTRPPGHHARSATTSGFCLVNNVAVAARHALDARGARRVFIFDWDVHHGDGTNDIFRTSDAVLFASIHQSGTFPGTGPLHDVGSGAGEGFSINLPVPARSEEDAWVSLLEHIAVPAALEFGPDLVLISAGYDAHRDDVQGGCGLEAGSFAEMARHCGRSARRWGLRSAWCWRAATPSTLSPPRWRPRSRRSRARSRPRWWRRTSSPRRRPHIGHYWTL